MTVLYSIITDFSNSIRNLVSATNSFLSNYENSDSPTFRNVPGDDWLGIYFTVYFLDLLCVDIGFPYLNDQEKADLRRLLERIMGD